VNAECAVGIDVGGTNVKAVAFDRITPSVLLRRAAPLEGRSVASVARHLLTEIEDSQGRRVDAVGVAAPGIVARDGRSIWWMQGRLSGLEGLDWTHALHRAEAVPVINDARAALLAEFLLGDAKSENMLMLTLGTGVGGAAMVNGEVLEGHLGRAGHLGHITVNAEGAADIVNTPGSLENAIGDCTIEQRSGGRFRSTLQLIEALPADETARQVWAKSIRALAAGIASLINVLDPELIVLGGGIAAAGERLFAPLRAEMEKFEWRPHGQAVRIVPATLGEFAGAIGAATNAAICRKS
jgi:glucokinase